jgi:hypothetical protein
MLLMVKKSAKSKNSASCKFLGRDHRVFCDARSEIVIEEGGKKYIGLNPQEKRFALYRVDDGLIKGMMSKCDYLLIECSSNGFYLIELKGSDLKHAATQIISTIKWLLPKIVGEKRIYARIVLTKVTSVALKSTEYISLQKLVKEHGGDLKQKSSAQKLEEHFG